VCARTAPSAGGRSGWVAEAGLGEQGSRTAIGSPPATAMGCVARGAAEAGRRPSKPCFAAAGASSAQLSPLPPPPLTPSSAEMLCCVELPRLAPCEDASTYPSAGHGHGVTHHRCRLTADGALDRIPPLFLDKNRRYIGKSQSKRPWRKAYLPRLHPLSPAAAPERMHVALRGSRACSGSGPRGRRPTHASLDPPATAGGWAPPPMLRRRPRHPVRSAPGRVRPVRPQYFVTRTDVA
jgi:hypothetical protein